MMINKSNILKIGLIGLVILAIIRFGTSQEPTSQQAVKSATQNSPDQKSHPVIFYDEWRFFQGIKFAEEKNRILPYEIKSGIIPHHLLASSLIADLFKTLGTQDPETIILLGPNHFEKGDFKALTSRYSWQTPFGLVEADENIVNELAKKNLVQVDEDILPQEHSVVGIMPFLKFYLPDTKVVPIIISRTMNEKEIDNFADSLAGLMRENTVIITAVDFSHYLKADQAAENDAMTLQIIKDFDSKRLFGLGNDYLDSAPAIAVLLISMQKLQAQNLEVLQHANSADFLGNPINRTTSYFSIIFH